MNERVDMFSATLEAWRCLGRGDRARAMDHMFYEMGEICPIPALEDVSDEIEFWLKTTPMEVQVMMLKALFRALPKHRQTPAIEWFRRENEKPPAD